MSDVQKSRGVQKDRDINLDETPAEKGLSESFVLASVSACFLLSGFAALLYQTVWMRQFSVVFGTSEMAVATVLSSYMAGLALGAVLVGRFVHKVRNPVLVYGFLEGLIALSALAVPYLLKVVAGTYALALGGQEFLADASGVGQAFFYLLVAFLVILVPTASMGATLPLLTKYVIRTREQIGPRVGVLYAINTLGAIAGTLVAAFYLLPALGLMGTLWCGVVISFLIFLVASTLAKKISPEVADKVAVKKTMPSANPDVEPEALKFMLPGPHWILPIMLVSGAVTFTYEVLWTRLLSHILGGSVVAFATMLASFLGGITLGSALASRFSRNWQASFNGFVVCQVGIALTSVGIYKFLDLAIPATPGLYNNILIPIMILLPATLFIGATFPLAVRVLAHDLGGAPESSARVYAWNTFGGILGAAIAGFFLIPLLKYEGAIKVAVITNMALALFACLLIGKKQHWVSVPAFAAAVLLAVFYNPLWPENILRVSPIGDSPDGELRYYGVGRSSTVLVLERDGYLYLRNNGLAEASIDLIGAPPAKHTQRLLTALPYLARPAAKEILMIGYGGGVALEGIIPAIERVDVLELEAKVIEANARINALRNIDPLEDPRIHVYINDARSALQLTDKAWDIVVSQPSHPWTAGASHLYTREFMQLAKGHLKDSGVFLQWMNGEYISEALLQSLTNTLLQVFENVRVYNFYPGVLFFLASDASLDMEQEITRTGIPFEQDRKQFMKKGIASVEDMLANLLMDEHSVREFSKGAPIITDDKNLMATSSTMSTKEGVSLSLSDLERLTLEYSPVFNPESWVYQGMPEGVNLAYLGSRYETNGTPNLKEKLAELLYQKRDSAMFTVAATMLLRNKQTAQGIEALVNAFKADPSDESARFMLMWEYKDEIANGTAPEVIQEQYSLLTGSAKAVIDIWPDAIRRRDEGKAMRADSLLGEALPNDLWFLQAAKLRADWRIQYPDLTLREQYAKEALTIIDEVISIYQDLDFYGMRIAASFLADEHTSMLETIRRMISVMSAQLDVVNLGEQYVFDGYINNNQRRISSVSVALEQVQDLDDFQAYKLKEIRSQIERLQQRYQDVQTVRTTR